MRRFISVAFISGCAVAAFTLPAAAATRPSSQSTTATSVAVKCVPARCVPAPPAATATKAPTTPGCPSLACAGEEIHFAVGSAAIAETAQPGLHQLAVCLQRHPDVQLVVEGNTDERGSAASNLRLGERRARAVSDQLISLGARPDQLRIDSGGEENPACLRSNESCWQVNRRVDIIPQQPGTVQKTARRGQTRL